MCVGIREEYRVQGVGVAAIMVWGVQWLVAQHLLGS